MFSNQLCTLSTREIIAASLFRITAWECKGFPKTFLCDTHLCIKQWDCHRCKPKISYLRHSSMMNRCTRAEEQHITHRSWLKLLEGLWVGLQLMIVKPHLKMTNIPPPSGPSVFSTGTLTFSNVTYAVPAVGDWIEPISRLENPHGHDTHITCLDRLCLNPLSTFHQNDRETPLK